MAALGDTKLGEDYREDIGDPVGSLTRQPREMVMNIKGTGKRRGRLIAAKSRDWQPFRAQSSGPTIINISKSPMTIRYGVFVLFITCEFCDFFSTSSVST
jgi:hypothetical protein